MLRRITDLIIEVLFEILIYYYYRDHLLINNSLLVLF